jgi:hypothetical protein
MWYPTFFDTEQTTQSHNAQAEQFDEHVPPSVELEKAKAAATPGTEYWLP